MPKLTIKIIDLGTSYTNPETGRVSPSLTGAINSQNLQFEGAVYA
jgi:hypothetical protein